jgi:hypothetical protein
MSGPIFLSFFFRDLVYPQVACEAANGSGFTFAFAFSDHR